MSESSEPGAGVFSLSQIRHLMRVEFGRAQRYGYPLSALVIAVDRLDELRDRFGYEFRETVLEAVIELLQEETRTCDYLGRLMDDRHHERLLFGDISAVTQINRARVALPRLLEREDWHGRLLFGTDYPLPGVLPLISVNRLVGAGLLPAAEAPVLNEIRRHNPLLFDFVLKRRLGAGGKRFAAQIFRTRPFFESARARRPAGAPAQEGRA